MKDLTYQLDEYQLSSLASVFRDKVDVIRFWMRVTQLAINYIPPELGTEVATMKITISKMSRIFLEHGDNSFSVNFPFMIRIDDEGTLVYTHSCEDIDSQTASSVIGLIDGEGILTRDSVLDFADPLLRVTDEDPQVWSLLRDLILADDGYVRFDHDPVREDGRLHPLNHIDIFYSSGASFKVGLSRKLGLGDFSDILDTTTDCHFLAQ